MKKMMLAIALLLGINATGRSQSKSKLSYDQLITTGAQTQHGFFTIHAVGNKYYFEIPDSMLGRSIMIISRIVQAPEGSAVYTDDQTTDVDGSARFIRFEKRHRNTIALYTAGYKGFPGAVSSPAKPAASFGIKSLSKDGTASIIDVTSLLLSNENLVSGNAAALQSFQAYKDNIQLRAFRPNMNAGNKMMEINTSLILLSKIPMRVRYADKRIGYFKTIQDNKGIKKIEWINRWRAEPREEDIKKYKSGELVEPKEPIVIYIDTAFPEKWIPYIIQGVNDWQPALEKAGFKNAICARRAPSKKEDSTWSLQSCKAAVVYKRSAGENALSPHIRDPRSGEIIQSRINFDQHVFGWLQKLYMIQAGPNDPKARTLFFDDALMGKLVRNIIAHETGHVLGLSHNMGASSTVPVEKLRDKAWLDSNGVCPSIMDYVRYNYVAQPGDSLNENELIPVVGGYDKWAIAWGYHFFPQRVSTDEENVLLKKWALERSKDHRLWYGEDMGAISVEDPRAQIEDIGDNATEAGDYGIKNLQYVMSHLLEWTKGDTSNLIKIYNGISGFTVTGEPKVGQYGFYMLHALANVGSRYKMYDAGEDNITYEYVPANRQKEAVLFLNRQLFTTPGWLIDSQVVNRTGENPLFITGRIQRFILDRLFNNSIPKLLQAENIPGNKTYTAAELLTDLKNGIWSELETHTAVDSFRASLQNTYIMLLQKTIAESGTSAAPGIIKKHLGALKKEIENTAHIITDLKTKDHLQDILKKIDPVVQQ